MTSCTQVGTRGLPRLEPSSAPSSENAPDSVGAVLAPPCGMHVRSAVALALLLTACGSGGGDDSASGTAGQSSTTDAGSTTADPSASGGTSSASAGATATVGGDTQVGDSSSGDTTDGDTDSNSTTSGTTNDTDDTNGTDGSTGDTEADTESSSSTGDTTGSASPDVLDITFISHNDCTFTVTPPSITVPEGTSFTVNWVSSPLSEVDTDIAKIDPFNHVPIVIGHLPGTSYHDDIREWCGFENTGTFDFRLTSCFEPTYIPVDCGG